MLSEKIYRRLLVVYPKEHRREYGELMVQLFRDRMRRDGGGFRGLVVWMQMIFDLAGAAFKEHKEGVEMTKRRIWIGAGLVAMLLAGVVGASTILAQSNGLTVISTAHDFRTFSDEGADALADAMRQAVGEGAIDQETANGLVWALDRKNAPPGMWRHYFPFPEGDVLTEAMQQAVEEGVITQETADRVVHGFNGDSALETWGHYSFAGVDRFADALRQAVEEGLITQEAADRILRSLDDENVQ